MNTTPIKFMAYNPNSGENGIIYVNHTFESICATKLYNFNDIKFMQLTALRSINDEPIYNHQIVKSTHEDYAYTKHYLVDMFNYKVMAYLSDCKLEIIGNSFQHSELLELCK